MKDYLLEHQGFFTPEHIRSRLMSIHARFKPSPKNWIIPKVYICLLELRNPKLFQHDNVPVHRASSEAELASQTS